MSRDIDASSENVFSDWSRRVDEEYDAADSESAERAPAWGTASTGDRLEVAEHSRAPATASEPVREPTEDADPPQRPDPDPAGRLAPAEDESPPPAEPNDDFATPMPIELSHEHAAGELEIPDGYAVLEGVAEGGRRAVGVVVSRLNGRFTTRLLERALDELATAGVRREAITVMVVPGAFELPLAATALAKTRRFACVVALGCVIRGDTPHFDYVAGEAASGLQLAALETGVPVSFGVLTLDRVEQAEPRFEKGAEAVRSALEMAAVFSQLRAAAAREG
jgi:6,7-dimethyl-8-ribityllumazine synthase